MSFPLTHLLVAEELLTRRPREDEAQYLLGAIAPDGVHYRKNISHEKGALGPAKKIAHLCPVSEELWGYVTDNDGWVECISAFTRKNISSLAAGYATHCLTDLYNNKTLWTRFRTSSPEEAAKGYQSRYYDDLRNIDTRLYLDLAPKVERIWSLLAASTPTEMPGLVSTQEIADIKENILYQQYKGPLETPSQEYSFITYEESLEFIQKAADFIELLLK